MKYLSLLNSAGEIVKQIVIENLSEDEAISIDEMLTKYLPRDWELALTEEVM